MNTMLYMPEPNVRPRKAPKKNDELHERTDSLESDPGSDTFFDPRSDASYRGSASSSAAQSPDIPVLTSPTVNSSFRFGKFMKLKRSEANIASRFKQAEASITGQPRKCSETSHSINPSASEPFGSTLVGSSYWSSSTIGEETKEISKHAVEGLAIRNAEIIGTSSPTVAYPPRSIKSRDTVARPPQAAQSTNDLTEIEKEASRLATSSTSSSLKSDSSADDNFEVKQYLAQMIVGRDPYNLYATLPTETAEEAAVKKMLEGCTLTIEDLHQKPQRYLQYELGRIGLDRLLAKCLAVAITDARLDVRISCFPSATLAAS